ncbi:unnamed protein product [Durusdinium trenchii]|uniref:Transmembrane protein 107 n=1 Tax=Durusdinium trenchii TaxID=1381693 RepID=A0ABP0PWM4_9DINO
MFAIQHGDQEHEFGQTRYLFSHAVSTLCSFTMSSFLVAQQTLVQAGCNPRVCEAFLGLLTVVLLVLRPWHLPRVLRRMEFNVFFTFGFLWIIELSHSLDHFLRHRALLALKEGTEGCEVEMGTTGEAETRLEPTGA